MSLLDHVFAQPELIADPPVLVDVGAAGGVHETWRRIARYSIGVGFEPDAREAAPLDRARKLFRRWILCPGLAMPEGKSGSGAKLHLTRSPQCSSTLLPNTAALNEWAFAESFIVESTRSFPASTVADALTKEGIGRVDWLKCDTQGLDLKLYFSLPQPWRMRMLATEFEPGLTDVYKGEDKLADVLAAMGNEPFWLAGLQVGHTPRGRPVLLAQHAGGVNLVKWVRRLAPGAPAWANALFLRDVALASESLDRRAHLLAWVFATICKQHGQALTIAAIGEERYGSEIFASMSAQSARSLRWAMMRGLPAMIWRVIRR